MKKRPKRLLRGVGSGVRAAEVGGHGRRPAHAHGLAREALGGLLAQLAASGEPCSKRAQGSLDIGAELAGELAPLRV